MKGYVNNGTPERTRIAPETKPGKMQHHATPESNSMTRFGSLRVKLNHPIVLLHFSLLHMDRIWGARANRWGILHSRKGEEDTLSTRMTKSTCA